MIISWNTTNKCNLTCSHCYRDAGEKYEDELTTQEAKRLIGEIAESGFKIMIFSGGEPLMRDDIFELIEYASGLGLRPVIGTNGTMITREIAQRLKSSGVLGAGISLDSLDASKHNGFRGSDTAYRDTLLGMKNCREAGLRFQIHTTVMDWNKSEIVDITDFAVAMGASAYHVFFLVPTGRGGQLSAEMLGTREYEALLADIMKKQSEVDIEVKPTCAPQFIRIAEENDVKTRFSRGCLAGISYCIVNPKGVVQPCAYFDKAAGSVKERSFSEIWRESELFNELRTETYGGSCGTCGYKSSCGGCRARAAYYNNGDYMAEESLCSLSSGIEVE